MAFLGRGINKANLTAFQLEMLLPAEMPRAFGFTPRVAVTSFMPPMPDVFDRDYRSQEAAAVATSGAFAFR